MMKILFMGTPDFALSSLKALCEAGENVVGVVTQTDKPKGRGYEMMPPPVKVYAVEKGLPVYQPKTLRGEEFDTLLHEIDPDMIVVVAFGKILPENVINYPRLGCINVHGSLLPRYRGAAPMQRAIINGEKITGITTMYMDAGLDTGDMILRSEVAIGENDNFEDIHDALAECGAKLLLETVSAVREGIAPREKQNESEMTYAAKIEKTDCLIDFGKTASKVHDLIRGLSPIPLAFTHTPDGKLLKVISSRISDSESECEGEAGKVTALDGSIKVKCGKGEIELLRVLPEGKGRMDASDYIRGRKIAVGDILA
ncbi:MAG: methionyl-tRNA formyltransferase [Clostridia bacterium]|nr:methionyl-tRNA formyltransferase [Clostridia bacterium]